MIERDVRVGPNGQSKRRGRLVELALRAQCAAELDVRIAKALGIRGRAPQASRWPDADDGSCARVRQGLTDPRAMRKTEMGSWLPPPADQNAQGDLCQSELKNSLTVMPTSFPCRPRPVAIKSSHRDVHVCLGSLPPIRDIVIDDVVAAVEAGCRSIDDPLSHDQRVPLAASGRAELRTWVGWRYSSLGDRRHRPVGRRLRHRHRDAPGLARAVPECRPRKHQIRAGIDRAPV